MAVLMLACVVVVAVSRVTVFVFSTHVLFFVEGVVLASLDARVGLYRLARIFINLVRRISFRCIHLTSLSTHVCLAQLAYPSPVRSEHFSGEG